MRLLFVSLSSTQHRFSHSDVSQLIDESQCVLLNVFFCFFPARSERYHHLASDEDEETNDEESSLEIRQFASWSHRFSKVKSRSGSPKATYSDSMKLLTLRLVPKTSIYLRTLLN